MANNTSEAFVIVRMEWVEELGSWEAAGVYQRIQWRCERSGSWSVTAADLAEEVGLSVYATRKALRTLVEAGWIETERTSAWDPTPLISTCSRASTSRDVETEHHEVTSPDTTCSPESASLPLVFRPQADTPQTRAPSARRGASEATTFRTRSSSPDLPVLVDRQGEFRYTQHPGQCVKCDRRRQGILLARKSSEGRFRIVCTLCWDEDPLWLDPEDAEPTPAPVAVLDDVDLVEEPEPEECTPEDMQRLADMRSRITGRPVLSVAV